MTLLEEVYFEVYKSLIQAQIPVDQDVEFSTTSLALCLLLGCHVSYYDDKRLNLWNFKQAPVLHFINRNPNEDTGINRMMPNPDFKAGARCCRQNAEGNHRLEKTRVFSYTITLSEKTYAYVFLCLN